MISLGLLLGWSLFAQHVQWTWKTYTSARKIRDMVLYQGGLWCATEGGLLSFDIQNQTFSAITNTEGLAEVDVTALAVDASGDLWIGTANGYLQRYSHESRSWKTITDYTDYHIHRLALHNDSLFVALDIGLSVFLISRQEVKETYKHLGTEIQSEITVSDIQIDGDGLWAITEQGLAFTELNRSNLLDPLFWTNVTADDGLPATEISALYLDESQLFAATSQGIYTRLPDGTWDLQDSAENWIVRDFLRYGTELVAVTENNLIRFDGLNWINMYSDLPGGRSLATDGEYLYAGTDEGIYMFSSDGLINHFLSNGPGSNFFSDLAVDQDGSLWCCSADYAGSSGSGFFKMNQDHWTVFNKRSTDGILTDYAVSVMVDHLNRKWIGTWGKGVLMLENDTTFTYYNPENGYLNGIEGHPEYAVVKGLTEDAYGTVWMLNREAYGGQVLVSVTSDGIWASYGASQRLTSGVVWAIAVDAYQRKWITTTRRDGNADGVFIFDDTDPVSGPVTARWDTGDGLLSNNVQAIAIDADNTVWLGTDLGLNYYTGSEIREQYGLQSANVHALLVDGANNLWVGTNSGVCYFLNETYEWICFNTENSGLVNDEVLSLAMNEQTGEVFIGTTHGLSVVTTPYSAPEDRFTALRVIPNPFMPEKHGTVSIENLPQEVTISIFTSNGHLVFQKPSDTVYGNTFLWDGRDTEGKWVPGGIYLIVVNNKISEKSIGKLAVIR